MGGAKIPRMLLPLSLAMLSALPLAETSATPRTPPAAQERQSLEQLLARARARQQELQGKLSGDVAMLIAELEAHNTAAGQQALQELDARLIALGTDATPLLVRYIATSDDALDAERLRAARVVGALSRMDTAAITGDLLRLLDTASNDGKRNALRVLEHSKDPTRVLPVVEAHFKRAEGTLKQACMRTLVALGADAKAIFAELMHSTDENLTAMALATMTETRNAAAAEQVRWMLLESNRAGTHALALMEYFKALPALATEAEALAFIRLANGPISTDTRVALIEALPDLKPRLSSDLRKALEPIVGSSDRRLLEAGLVALARLGDKGSKKKLLDGYDERIKQNEEWSQAWVDRGDVYFRIDEYDGAIKDYVKAIQLGTDDRALRPETYIKLARCYMRTSKLKEAGFYVSRAPISMAQRRALADDPEFKPLRDSKHGKDAFGIE